MVQPLLDGAGELGPPRGGLAARVGREHRPAGPGPDADDDRLDLPGGLLGPLGELAHLGGDDREAAPVLAGPGRLDRGVEGEQVGLVGQVVDDGQDAVDLGGALLQAGRLDADLADPRRQLVDGVDRQVDDRAALTADPGHLVGRLGHLVRRLRDAGGGVREPVQARGGLGDGGGLLGGAVRRLHGGRGQLGRRGRQLPAVAADPAQDRPQRRDLAQRGREQLGLGGQLGPGVVVLAPQPAQRPAPGVREQHEYPQSQQGGDEQQAHSP